MTEPAYSIVLSAKLDGASGTIAVGDVLIRSSSTGYWVKATAANRGTRRARAISLSAAASGGVVQLQQSGSADTTITGLSATGTASWVRVSAAGSLERCTPGAGDDLFGKVDEDGVLTLCPGVWDSTNYAGGGGGGGTPGGADTQVQRNNAGAFGGISGVTTDGTGLTSLKIKGSGGAFYYSVAGAAIVADRTLNLPLLTGADTVVCAAFTQTLTNKTIDGASNTLTVRIANDVSGLAANVATFLGTPSGANLAAALTSALPASKGGTGLTALGANVATWLGTPSSANLAAALTDETGTGAAVFGTTPTISTPILDQGVRWTNITTNANTGTQNNVALSSKRILQFTNAAGPTVTGIDATGMTDGDEIIVFSSGGSFILNHLDAGSSAANQIDTGGVAMTIPAGPYIRLRYFSSKWHAPCGLAV